MTDGLSAATTQIMKKKNGKRKGQASRLHSAASKEQELVKQRTFFQDPRVAKVWCHCIASDDNTGNNVPEEKSSEISLNHRGGPWYNF